MTTYSPASWANTEFRLCGSGGVWSAPQNYCVRDNDTYSNLQVIRFPNVVVPAALASASLHLARTPQSSTNPDSGANGIISVRLEDSTNAAQFGNSGTANPWNRTYRSAEVEVDFSLSGTAIDVDLLPVFNDFVAAHGAGTFTLSIAFGAYNRGWTSATVACRNVCCNSTGSLPVLTLVEGSSGTDVQCAGAAIAISYALSVASSAVAVPASTVGLSVSQASAASNVASSGETFGNSAHATGSASAEAISPGMLLSVLMLQGSSGAAVAAAGVITSFQTAHGSASGLVGIAGIGASLGCSIALAQAQATVGCPGISYVGAKVFARSSADVSVGGESSSASWFVGADSANSSATGLSLAITVLNGKIVLMPINARVITAGDGLLRSPVSDCGTQIRGVVVAAGDFTR